MIRKKQNKDKAMKKKIFRIVLFLLALLIALYVTGFRLFTFIFEFGFKTPQTDNFNNFIKYNLPDLISVVFCSYFIVFFFKKLRDAISNKTEYE